MGFEDCGVPPRLELSGVGTEWRSELLRANGDLVRCGVGTAIPAYAEPTPKDPTGVWTLLVLTTLAPESEDTLPADTAVGAVIAPPIVPPLAPGVEIRDGPLLSDSSCVSPKRSNTSFMPRAAWNSSSSRVSR